MVLLCGQNVKAPRKGLAVSWERDLTRAQARGREGRCDGRNKSPGAIPEAVAEKPSRSTNFARLSLSRSIGDQVGRFEGQLSRAGLSAGLTPIYLYSQRRRAILRAMDVLLGLAILSTKPRHPRTHQEIAAYCGCSWQAIRDIEQRALKKLARRLSEIHREHRRGL